MIRLISVFLIIYSCLEASVKDYSYIFPVPGSSLNARNSSLIIKSQEVIDAESLRNSLPVNIRGSISGTVSYTMKLAEDNRTLLVIPDKLFQPAEIVSIFYNGGIRTISKGELPHFQFDFAITPLEKPIDALSLLSEKAEILADTVPPDFPTMTIHSVNNPAPGKIYLTNFSQSFGTYLIILDSAGKPFKWKKTGIPSFDFKVQPNGLFSYQQPIRPSPAGDGWAPSMSRVTNYDFLQLDSFQMKNGYTADFHDFMMAPNGNIFMLSYDPQPYDMSKVVKGGNPNAIVIGAIVQEMDIDKNVIFQWRSWDHIPITETYNDVTAAIVDYMHINAIELDYDANIMISSRAISQITKINRQTGNIIWKLGGKSNEFKFINDHEELKPTYFSEQHDIRRLVNGNITLFDNGNQHVPEYSRAVEYKIDEDKKEVTLVWEYRHTPDIVTKNQGSAQRLPDGSTLICWGGAGFQGLPSITEVHPDNTTALELSLPKGVTFGQTTYRAFKYPWLPGKASYTSEIPGFKLSSVVDLDTPGIKIKATQIDSTSGSMLYITKYDWAPRNPRFNGKAPHVLKYRITALASGIHGIEFEVRFAINKYPWIKLPDKYSIYYRSNEGSGPFLKLQTTLDNAANELVANAPGLGEFIFGMEPSFPKPSKPVLISPANGKKINKQKWVVLRWAAQGFATKHNLQVASDNGFSNIIKDFTVESVSFDSSAYPLDAVHYWRVRSYNEAGWGDWSDVWNFVPTLPFIQVISPNGGEKWQRDSVKYIIKWDENLAESIKIDLYKNNEYYITIRDTISRKTGACWWTIPNVVPYGNDYKVKITSILDTNLYSQSSNFFEVIPAIISVEKDRNADNIFRLTVSPNPFTESINMSFSAPVTGGIGLKVIDIFGKPVENIINETLVPGLYELKWEPRGIAPGIYFIQIVSGNNSETKMIIYNK